MRNRTSETFKDKWEHNRQLTFEETLEEGSDIFSWILTRNGFRTCEELKDYLREKSRLLDAGCGNGWMTAFLRRYSPVTTEVVGIDLVSSEIARHNLEAHRLTYAEAMQVCNQITEFGRSLSDRGIKIQVPRIEALEIKKGEYDLQRFIYHFSMKCFWSLHLTFQENVAINFDWYHPKIASRHTLEEVKEWFIRAKLRITHEYSDFYGITLRGKLA